MPTNRSGRREKKTSALAEKPLMNTLLNAIQLACGRARKWQVRKTPIYGALPSSLPYYYELTPRDFGV
jgi:hypothetical protein